MKLARVIAVSILAVVAGTAHAGVLPEDRADVLYHAYIGGGVEIDGPSVLVRKQVGNSLSFVESLAPRPFSDTPRPETSMRPSLSIACNTATSSGSGASSRRAERRTSRFPRPRSP